MPVQNTNGNRSRIGSRVTRHIFLRERSNSSYIQSTTETILIVPFIASSPRHPFECSTDTSYTFYQIWGPNRGSKKPDISTFFLPLQKCVVRRFQTFPYFGFLFLTFNFFYKSKHTYGANRKCFILRIRTLYFFFLRTH